MAKVTPLQPTKAIANNLPKHTSSTNIQSNQPNSTSKGQVTKVLGNDNYLIKVAGKEIPINSKTELQLGQTVTINNKNSQLEIKLNNSVPTPPTTSPTNSNTILTQGISNLGGNISVSSILELLPINIATLLSTQNVSILQQFSSLETSSNSKTDLASLLKLQVNKLGLNHEQNINSKIDSANLKNSLLEILSVIGESKDSAQLKEEVSKAIRSIEFFQTANVSQNSDEATIFPLFFDFLEQGFIKLLKDQQNSQETEDNLKFSLHLQLENLGNMQIEFSGSSSGIYIHFYVESEDEAAALTENMHYLEDKLNETNIVKGIRVAVGVSPPANEIMQLCRPKDHNLLDTTA